MPQGKSHIRSDSGNVSPNTPSTSKADKAAPETSSALPAPDASSGMVDELLCSSHDVIAAQTASTVGRNAVVGELEQGNCPSGLLL
jgi:hypothetical protein